MAKKISPTAKKFVQDFFFKQATRLLKDDISKKKAEELKLDTSAKEIVVGNIKLKRQFIDGSYSTSLINKQKDLDGNFISKNSDLLEKLKNLETRDKERITYKDFKALNIHPTDSTYKVGKNFKLSRISLGDGDYYIEYVNKKKDGENRWKDKYVTLNNVWDSINSYKLTKAKYNKFQKHRQSEVQWNNDLLTHLENEFRSVKKGNQRYAEIDINVGNGIVGIELKWANKVNTENPKNSTVGQVGAYYDSEKFEYLILLVAGTKADNNPVITDLRDKVKKKYKCHSDYLSIK